MILFDGCSVTYGDELQGPDNNHEHRIKNRFSHVVAEELGDNYVNLGICGKSNDGILRTTLEYCENHKVDLAIIQFTVYSRREVLKEGQKLYWHLSAQSDKPISKAYFQNISNINDDAANFHKNKFLLENYFKSRKIKYYFVTLVRDMEISGFIPSSWYNMMDKTPIWSIRESTGRRRENPERYCKRYVGHRHLSGGHPSELGHKLIAEHILENI